MLDVGSPIPLPSCFDILLLLLSLFRVLVGSLFVTSCGRALPSLPPGPCAVLGDCLFVFFYVLFFFVIGFLYLCRSLCLTLVFWVPFSLRLRPGGFFNALIARL